jgi:hypothetical protein
MKFLNSLIFLLLITHLAFANFKITAVDGDVKVNRNSSSFKAKEGTPLKPGDEIVVGEESLCEIEIGEDNLLSLSEKTTITLDKDPDVNKTKGILANISQGILRCQLNKLKGRSFTVKAPCAVAGVRGTDFITTYNPKANDDDAYDLSVLEGEVELRPIDKLKKMLKAQRIKAGFQVGVKRDGRLKGIAKKMIQARLKILKEKHPIGKKMREVIKNKIQKRLMELKKRRGRRNRR